MNDKLQLIREKCIAANPEITEHATASYKFEALSQDEAGREYDGFCPTCLMTEVEAAKNDCIRPIRLADVLLAWSVSKKPDELLGCEVIVYRWNLRADDLEKQSERTINFLYELLS